MMNLVILIYFSNRSHSADIFSGDKPKNKGFLGGYSIFKIYSLFSVY